MMLKDLCDRAIAEGITLGRLAVMLEAEETGVQPEVILDRVRDMLKVMKDAVKQGLSTSEHSRSGLSGGDAVKVFQASHGGGQTGTCQTGDGQAASGQTANGLPGNSLLSKALAYALAVTEVNACMGRIVAAPTAGSCGVIPGVFLAYAELAEPTCAPMAGPMPAADDVLLDGLCAAGLIGQVISEKIGVSGAEGGCQAECGSAAAMAAAGLTQMSGGSPEACAHAAAMALKGLMGLVCDPVAGLVEVPCVKRNATSAGVALSAAEMALAGVRSRIPPDEVIAAMAEVGRAIPVDLRETARGGLATTPTGRRCARSL